MRPVMLGHNPVKRRHLRRGPFCDAITNRHTYCHLRGTSEAIASHRICGLHRRMIQQRGWVDVTDEVREEADALVSYWHEQGYLEVNE